MWNGTAAPRTGRSGIDRGMLGFVGLYVLFSTAGWMDQDRRTGGHVHGRGLMITHVRRATFASQRVVHFPTETMRHGNLNLNSLFSLHQIWQTRRLQYISLTSACRWGRSVMAGTKQTLIGQCFTFGIKSPPPYGRDA
jgi:hypothetical protein